MAINRPEVPSFKKNPAPALIYLAVFAAVVALLFGEMTHFIAYRRQIQEKNPFLQVTNRDFSLFLWQFPEYMRKHVSAKEGYLPGFQYENSIAMEPGQAENYVVAPPELLFLYHTWKRLVGNYWSSRAIKGTEFKKFLASFPEWLPKNWPKSPVDYKSLIDSLETASNADVKRLPVEVQRAFIGWKNYSREGDLINHVQPTFKKMDAFIRRFPDYERSDWRNIVMKDTPDYLISLFLGKYNPDDPVPESEMTHFLRIAYFNHENSI